jgi:hypothetical protein
MRTSTMTPIGAVARGMAGGTAGTLAMDLLLFARHRGGGGKAGFRAWELSEGIESWDQAPAPAHVGRRLIEGLFQRELSDRLAPLVNNVTHWGYGVVNGALYGLVAGSLRAPQVWFGLSFGAGVWGSGYVVLPAAKLYQPIWEYDRRTLANDLGAHLVYGFTTAATFRLLSPRRSR